MDHNIVTELLGVLMTGLFGLLGYIGKRLIEHIQEVVIHLQTLNHRVEKLEARMLKQEDK